MSKKRREPRAAVDWQSVRERLAAATRQTEEALHPSAERARQILVERARALARRPAEAERAEPVLELLSFGLGGELYGVETRHVHRIAPLHSVTPVPGTPGHFAGITRLHGQVLAVVDLRKLLGPGVEHLPEPRWLVTLGAGEADLAVLADSVEAVLQVRVGRIQPLPDDRRDARQRVLLRGVTHEALVVLDGEALLGDERLFIDHGAAAPQTARTP